MPRKGDEPVPGYRLLERLGRGTLGEVWKSTAPGGTFAALKFVTLSGKEGPAELNALGRFKHIRHSNLMPITGIWLLNEDGELIEDASSAVSPPTEMIVGMMLADNDLLGRLEECQAAGAAGMPPGELLDYMEDAAKAIDFLNSPRHELGAGLVAIQHGDVKPQNITIVGGTAQVCDFGLTRLLSAGRAGSGMSGSPAYTSPECIRDKAFSAASDQYSLAITYCQLRTGSLPFDDDSYLAILDAHAQNRLNLSRLPEGERAVVSKATSPRPEDRYASVLEMARAMRRAYDLAPQEILTSSEDSKAPAAAAATVSTAAAAAVDRPNGATKPAAQTNGATESRRPVAAVSRIETDPAQSSSKTASSAPSRPKSPAPSPTIKKQSTQSPQSTEPRREKSPPAEVGTEPVAAKPKDMPAAEPAPTIADAAAPMLAATVPLSDDPTPEPVAAFTFSPAPTTPSVSPEPAATSAVSEPKAPAPAATAQAIDAAAPAAGPAAGKARTAKGDPGKNVAADKQDAKSKSNPSGKGDASHPAEGGKTPGAKRVRKPKDESKQSLAARFQHKFAPRSLVRTSMAVLCSTAVHLILIIALGLWFIPGIVRPQLEDIVASVERPQELLNQLLQEDTDPTKELALVTTSSAPTSESSDSAAGGSVIGGAAPKFDATVAEAGEGPAVNVGDIGDFATPGAHFNMDVPEGTLGEPLAPVDNYQQAMDRITQEILTMLSSSKVLVIWCFDESESMKDDQQEIRERIEQVYTELGLSSDASGDALLTAVTSYGATFTVHTKKATQNRDEIRAAIGSVQVDETGKEVMCAAVGESINYYRKFATSGRRKLALILVTDEAGDFTDNNENLEGAIRVAKDARCPVYTLGREAVFGYPYAYMNWVDKETQINFWLRIDRGPETPYPEQLQVDGFTARWDAHPSGFGPYEQARMSHQTGGVFFMLPSLETNLVRGEKRRYELENMRPYLPDLSARQAYAKERDSSELRTILWKVISDFNPYRPESAPYCTVPVTFSIKPAEFSTQAETAKKTAEGMVRYIDVAEKTLEKLKRQRDNEYSPRWRANYDLMFAQLLAYKVRIYEYGAYLDAFQKQPKIIKNPLGPLKKTNHWDITTRQETLTGDLTKAYIERATALLQAIIKEHPGTPWAARAEWELNRGFGVDLVEDFDDPRASSVKVPNL